MPKMKDSGIEWIGQIPEDWNCCRQKYVIHLINGRAYKDSEFEEDGKYRILRVGNLFSNPVWYTSSLELTSDKYCEDGDLLYSWSMSYSPVIWSGEKVIYHYHIWKTVLNPQLDKMFAYYYLLALTDALKAEIHETTMGFITMGIMNSSYIAFPSLAKQRALVGFLDRKCSEIDLLREDIEAEIKTLEAYKKSVIMEAVTKGLNPDVEMKDSGIKSIGLIPHDWKVCRIKNLFSDTSYGIKVGPFGSSLGSAVVSEYEGEYKVYGQANLIRRDFTYGENYVREEDYHRLRGYEVLPDDVTVSMMGTIGKCAVVPKDIQKGIMDSHLIKIRLKKDYCPKYFEYLYESEAVYTQLLLQNKGTIMTGLNSSIVKGIYFLEPTLSEQERIADFLDTKCAEIDAVVKEKNTQLKLLTDYKKSLIYEYVTGKKEVPNE